MLLEKWHKSRVSSKMSEHLYPEAYIVFVYPERLYRMERLSLQVVLSECVKLPLLDQHSKLQQLALNLHYSDHPSVLDLI